MNIPGFKLADNTIKQRLICSVNGREKEGKTHFALTAPGPIALFNFDDGLEGVVQKFTDSKDIFVKRYHLHPDAGVDENTFWRNAWNEFIKDYYTALRSDQIRTIIIDTETDMNKLIRLKEFGRLDKILPHRYGPVNSEMTRLAQAPYAEDKNVIFLRRKKAEYINDKATGNYIPAGFSELPYLVQVVFDVYRDWENEGDHTILISSCRHDADLEYETLSGVMCSFPYAASFVTSTDLTDWSE